MTCPTIGDLFISDTINDRIMRRGHVDLEYISQDNYSGSYVDPRGITVDADFIYVSNTGDNGVLKFDITDYSLVDTFYNEGMVKPYGICNYGDWIYFVCYGVMFTNHYVMAYKKDNSEYMTVCGDWGTGDDQMKFAQGICTDGTHVYICDTGNHRIVKRLCADLSFVSKIGSSGTGDDQFTSPKAIGTYDGNLYVGDNAGTARLQKRLCSDLSFVSSLDVYGTTECKARQITSLCVTPYNLYLTDDIAHKIQERRLSDFSYVNMVGGASGSTDDKFNAPQGIAVLVT